MKTPWMLFIFVLLLLAVSLKVLDPVRTFYRGVWESCVVVATHLTQSTEGVVQYCDRIEAGARDVDAYGNPIEKPAPTLEGDVEI